MAEISYTKTNWVNNVTKLNADNMNHIENGIEAIDIALGTKADKSYVDNAIASSAVSPTVETEAIIGGTKVTITDKDGAHEFDVMNGVNGPAGKSAYASAQDGGFTGTEAQFNTDLAGVSGKYTKPTTGIPKTDLASAVQSSLEKADSALQQHQSLAAYRTAENQDVIDAGKQDKATTQTMAIAVADWNGGTTCTKSVTGVTANSIVIVDTSDGNVECTGQGAGTLTFTAGSTPLVTVSIKLLLFPVVINYTNQIPISVDTSGHIYNGVGYKEGYRLNSSGAEKAASDHAVTGYIPFTIGDTIRTRGFKATSASEGIQFYTSTFSNIAGYKGSEISQEPTYDIVTGALVWTPPEEIYDAGRGGTFDISNAAYIRISASTSLPIAKTIITINEEIS